MDELLLRELTPAVIGVLVHRGVDFATAEDAVQEALIQAALTWPDRQPADPNGWLVTVAWRKFLDARRSEVSRRAREQRIEAEAPPGPTETTDDTLQLFFLCAHPSLTPASGWRRCYGCSTWSSTRATPATSTWRPSRSGLPGNWRR
jgi:predicted RNA polymerase sigma factor